MSASTAVNAQGRFAAGGRLGVGTPQANPTVEDEFRILTRRDMSTNVVRLTSDAPGPEGRLVDYIETLPAALGGYDQLKPDVFGFACTGSSYLVGRDREEALIAESAARRGFPVVTAASAIVWALDRLGARRVVLAAPYPATLVAAGKAYFETRGVTVAAAHRIETASADTRSIYDLAWGPAAELLASLDLTGVDAVLISGTGMPSLPVVAAGHASGRPVVSSNYCLAANMLATIGQAALLDEQLGIAGWRDRLDEALA